MYLLYIVALLPMAIGFILKSRHKIDHIDPFLVSAGVGLLLAGIIHFWAYRGKTVDHETWSGRIVEARYVPAWKEYYEYAVYRTETYYETETYYDGNKAKTRQVRKTREVFDHWEPTSRWHSPDWTAFSNIGTQYDITEHRYKEFVALFGNQSNKRGRRTTSEHASRMLQGDPMDYHTYAPETITVPITSVKTFTNKVKATPSVFNFVKVPDDVKVFDYPENKNPWRSDRVINASGIDIGLWDAMNARLGPKKRVNLILINFDTADSLVANYQQSAWLGGKKNDLVLCKGVGWSKVFGWSESDICKRNLEALILNSSLDNNLIPLIEEEVLANYTKREYTEDFDYLVVEPDTRHWVVFIVLLTLTTGIAYYRWTL